MYVSNYKPNPKTGTVDDDDALFVPDSVRVGGAKHARHFGGQITPHSPVVAVAPLPPSRHGLFELSIGFLCIHLTDFVL